MKHRKLTLTIPKLAFLVSTRAALAAGVGLLVSGKLPTDVRRAIGIGLLSFGAISTIPAVRMIAHAR